jgi:AmmeMemoRadiSam system protein B
VSSDLSHYHDYATARRSTPDATAIAVGDGHCDRRRRRVRRAPDPRPAARGAAARPGRAAARSRSSGDTAGDRERVVGYGAFALSARARG